MTARRIHWSKGEKLAVAEATIEHQRIYPQSTLLQSVRAAQQVLDEDKRRLLRTTDDISDWIHQFMQLVLDMRQRDAELKQAHQAPPEVSHEAPPEAPESPPDTLQDIGLKQLTELWLGRFFDEFIAPQIEARANELFTEKTLQLIQKLDVIQGTKGRLHITVPEELRRKIRTRVLVYGLMGHQVTRVKQDFGDKLDLTFIGNDHKHDGLIDLAKNCDISVLMTRFIDHSVQNRIRDNAPHTVMVSGSVTDLSNILNSIVHEGKNNVVKHNFNQKSFN